MASVGVLTLELRLDDAHSLKDKRQTVKSLKDRLRGKFNSQPKSSSNRRPPLPENALLYARWQSAGPTPADYRTNIEEPAH